MPTKITTTPEIVTLQEAFLKAKDAKDQWAEYQLAQENEILAELVKLKVKLPETGTVQLEKVKVTTGTTRKWVDSQLNELAAENPHLVGSTLLVKYESALGKVKIDAIVAGGSELGAKLARCFSDKAKKPGFTAV